MCHWCSCHILKSSVIYYLYNNETNYYTLSFFFNFKILQHNAKAGLCPAFAHFGEDEKKPFDVIYDLYKMKQFHCLLCVAKKCDWSRKITPLSNLTRASRLVKWELTAKAELNCEIYKFWGKIKPVFVIRAALWAEKLGRWFENCRSWKNILGKLVDAIKLEAIWFEFWMKGE